MKKLSVLYFVLFSFLFSSKSFSNWTEIMADKVAITYIDYNRINKKDGFIYFWWLINWKNEKSSYKSTMSLYKVDCSIRQYIRLLSDHKDKEMGEGATTFKQLKDEDWSFSIPNSRMDDTLDIVCNYPKKN